MVKVSVTQYPEKEIVATCNHCGAVVKRREWDTYSDYKRLFFSMQKNIKQCPHCKKMAQPNVLQWEKHYDVYGRVTQDWEAKTDNGDFLIWKDGRIWKARYRAFNSNEPQMLGISSTRDGAKRLCQKSRFNVK